MEIKCDRCGAVADIVTPETHQDGDIEYTFFRCPDCDAVYPICATDSALRADIAEYTRMRNLIRVQPVKEAFIRRAEALKQKNMNRSKELMEQHPLVLFSSPEPAE